jgi:hypothetical protein
MKVFLEVDIKPFRGPDGRSYSGLYTPKGKKNQRARIEVNTKDSTLDQVDSHVHEFGHFLCDIYLGEAHKNSKDAYRREEAYCYALGRASKELFRRMINGEPLTGKVRIAVQVDEDEISE